ncbi:MAG: S8 family serine peptidase [Flavisolibacter sp.]
MLLDMVRCAALFIFLQLILFHYSSGQNKENRFISPGLENKLNGMNKDEVATLVIVSKDTSWLSTNSNIHLVANYHSIHIIKLPISLIPQLISSGKIQFADLHRIPKEELTTGSLDLGLNKISLVHDLFPLINGDSIRVSIKEQNFDTSDIDLKGRSFSTGLQAATSSSHASIMATIISGAGNSSSYALGVAPASLVTSSDFSSLLPDPDSIFIHNQISVQNHSYGTNIENYYGADALAYDLSAYNNPKLLYVFSAGNSGTSAPPSGSYSGLNGFANITGSFKMAKNILTVGATDSFNNIGSLSSRGPLYDGRIGPNLVAFGEDGTSGAAALVSGTASLLQQVYRQLYFKLPSSSLIRSVLINSADALDASVINYVHGFGSLNAFRALQTINENRFYEDSIFKNEVRSVPLHIPDGVAQLKITLVWNDTPSVANASKALVNDLDAKLQFPLTGEYWLPWVLNPAANVDSLNQPAQRKIDTLNTVEQISILHPASGDYLLWIDGSKIHTSSSQPFSVSWQFDSSRQIYWTYPTSNNVLQSKSQSVIRWQSNDTGTVALSYSTDGNNWNIINSNADLQKGYFKWNVPGSFSKCLLKITRQGSELVSDTFVISPLVSLKVGFDCKDSFLLYWNNIHADQYELKVLGEKYLQPYQTTTDTFAIIQKAVHAGLFYSVVPLIGGREALRSFTVNYTTQAANCYLRSFYALPHALHEALLSVELGSLYNVAAIDLKKWNGKEYILLQTIKDPIELSQSYTDSNLVRGLNLYRAEVILKNGQRIISSIESVSYFPDLPVLIFPNPSQQQNPVTILVKDQGIYSVRIMDALGKLVKQFDLNDISTSIPPFTLSKGLYFVQVFSESTNVFVQKLVVY